MSLMEMDPFIFDTINTFLYAVTGICILAAFGICYFVIDHTLDPTEAKRALTWVTVHQLVLVGFTAILMNTFVWNRPAIVPVVASTLILLVAFCCIIKVGFVQGRLERYIITPHIERSRHRSPTPNQEEDPY